MAVRADQGVWTRFPKGLPSGLKKGDEIVAEAAMGLTVDASLDFLAIPPGSKQVKSYDNATFGYLGPCPGGNVHSYEFDLYAVDAATLPGVTTSSSVSMKRLAIA